MPTRLVLTAWLALATPPPPATVTIDLTHPVATVPKGFFGAGYDGWGDITTDSGAAILKGLGLHYFRLQTDPGPLCGKQPGPLNLGYTVPRDEKLGFIDRVRTIQKLGWTPLLALTISSELPAWFHGDVHDKDGKGWFRYDTDGTFHAGGFGNQLDAWSRITADLAGSLRKEGLAGLHWETIYELGHDMPLAEIHYYGAKGIKSADPTAVLMGPATWPGWTVEERFVKPYLRKYGAELLDAVTVHWYGTNSHGLWKTGYDPAHGTVTAADHAWLANLMEVAPQFEDWTRSLRKLLDDPQLNPAGKRIGIVVTEMDVNAFSPYQHNPPNPHYPDYDPAADCYVNTNVFGGVWNASAWCHLLLGGADAALKFTTRDYYGLMSNVRDESHGHGYYRLPVWYALHLLTSVAGLRDGAPLLATTVDGPRDQAKEHHEATDRPWLECYATRSAEQTAVVLLQRGLEAATAELSLRGLAPWRYRVTTYRFDAERCQRFIGPAAGQREDGSFEPESRSRCEEPVATAEVAAAGDMLQLHGIECPGVSMTVLVIRPAG